MAARRRKPSLTVQEFEIMQAGVFNFIMTSGSNRLHGSVYGAPRNEALNANTRGNTSAA